MTIIIKQIYIFNPTLNHKDEILIQVFSDWNGTTKSQNVNEFVNILC